MKICNRCNLEKNINQFYKRKCNKDGYENFCKECNLKSRKRYKYTCCCCNEEFTSYNTKQYKNFYCSNDCKNKHYGVLYTGENNKKYIRISVKCNVCGNEIKRNPHEIYSYKHHFCSLECKKQGFSTLVSGANNPNYNPNISDIARIINRNIFGYNEWRRNCFERDNYTCQNCNDATGGNLIAHHIFNYSEHSHLQTDINNSITLCEKCHKLFHNTYGYKKNSNLQLQEFLSKS